MGSSDSLSLPSEAPDIGKWFSSYVYKSPELNSLDDFKDSSGSIVAETEESPNESKQNLYGNKLTRSDDLLLDGKGNSDVFVKCKNHTRNDNYAREVLEHSDSLSLGSEPPDVKQWFCSYVYESPVLDTSYEFRSDHKQDEAYEEENDAQSCSKEKEVTLSNLLSTCKDDYEGQNIPSDGLVKCINFVGDTENEDPYIPEDNQKANSNQNSATPNDLMSQWNSDQILRKKRVQDQGNGSAKDFVIAGSSPDKLSSKFNPKVSHVMLNIKSGSHKKSGKLAQESIMRRNLREEGSKAEEYRNGIAIVVSAENIEVNRVDAEPVKKTGGSSDKENDTNFGGNGFVSTRKSISKRDDKENPFRRPFKVKSDPLKNEVIISPCSSKEAITRTKVLSDTTNFGSSNAIEVIGKWRCPQKSKPNLGPPLKQLRLDQWVRRV